MKQSRWQRIHYLFWRAVYNVWNLRWSLPVFITHWRKRDLLWKQEYAWQTMRDVLDDLETRGDEVSARARLYIVLTTVNWQ